MRTIAKAALGGLALVSLGALAASPANAQASFGFSFGTGPVYGGNYSGYMDPCLRPYPYRPYYCGYGYVAPVAPIYGYYYPRPYPYRYYYGTRYGRYWDRDRDRYWNRDRYARR
jgi:hypothetical protein